jgi:hypothetical protein
MNFPGQSLIVVVLLFYTNRRFYEGKRRRMREGETEEELVWLEGRRRGG